MNTHRNPILLGQVETIDLLPPEVRTMLQRQGIYLASDSARPGFTVPLVVNADGLWSLQLDSQLDPERFNRTVQIAGPFYAPGEVIAAPDAACTCPSGDGSLRYPCPKHANECLPAVAATVSKMETTTPAAAQEAALIVEALKHSKATACAYPEARKRHEDALAAAESMLAAAAAPGIDVEQFREAVELLAWQNEGHANPDFPRGDAKKHAEALRLLALIDASPGGGSDAVAWHIQHSDGLVSLRKLDSVDDDMRAQAAADGVVIRPLVFGGAAGSTGGCDAHKLRVKWREIRGLAAGIVKNLKALAEAKPKDWCGALDDSLDFADMIEKEANLQVTSLEVQS